MPDLAGLEMRAIAFGRASAPGREQPQGLWHERVPGPEPGIQRATGLELQPSHGRATQRGLARPRVLALLPCTRLEDAAWGTAKSIHSREVGPPAVQEVRTNLEWPD